MIDRRHALAGITAMFGSALFAPIARAAGAVEQARGAIPVISDGPPSVAIFTPVQRATMVALSERVIPTTDTPGAIAAKVPEFIEKMLADWASPDDKLPIIAGLDAIEARSQSVNRVSAAKATPAQQDTLLTEAMEGVLPQGKAFFEPFRQLVITGYYTSEIGITQEREYLPVPGEYNGAFPYSQVNKVYSA
ncbi:gluconate 2-dehydrogenase subunit 3 family protein [Sphingomonas sp. Leaf21]|uniref:gluconate 2-dehydrogenase subunit 3 family protein n=1 Tax=Sphingomonas sp. Leaf21 TaxID=2876550 RepID=UPI001E500742|nr:gluconate 2-dehydrogenase subunit 3 family protein [Sphingomonas sp. Leaf21]